MSATKIGLEFLLYMIKVYIKIHALFFKITVYDTYFQHIQHRHSPNWTLPCIALHSCAKAHFAAGAYMHLVTKRVAPENDASCIRCGAVARVPFTRLGTIARYFLPPPPSHSRVEAF